MSYFPGQDSIFRKAGDVVEQTLGVIADRYIGSAPKHQPMYRIFCEYGFKREADSRYAFDLAAKCRHARDWQFVYAWGKLWSDQDADANFSVSCSGPLLLVVNGERTFQSNIMHESFPERQSGISVKLRKGWNHFVLRFMKTAAGFGGRFGSASAKRPVHFLAPSPERDGQEGWIYSEPTAAETLSGWPGEGVSEADTGVVWSPKSEWSDPERQAGQLARLFGLEPGCSAWGRTKLRVASAQSRSFMLRGGHHGPVDVYVNGVSIFSADGDGTIAITVALPFGDHELLVESVCPGGDRWGFELEPASHGDGSSDGIRLIRPHPVEGADEPWMYVGPFSGRGIAKPAALCVMDTLYVGVEGDVYWRIDRPGCHVRAYLENPLFGHWNYPLGVTLYGLLQTGIELGRSDYVDYAADHIGLATAHDRYALWDRQRYGAAGINPLLSAIDSLDDCGSFGATTLAAMKVRELKDARGAVDRIARYIRHEQNRLHDGALYRVRGSVEFMKDTMWCDDLYMSTPFLCRYYELTGEMSYLDDAAAQFLLYRNYLYMPDERMMSHIYDFKFGIPNRIPWGRGNGWVLFSLAELLSVLPERHACRVELLAFYRDLCEGILESQGRSGLWHQVLNMPESYEESSCTSMFIYAFAKGIRYGWLLEPAPYVGAVQRGWEGLTRISIDKHGNVYGVCRGSGYSFSPLYYKDELPWNLNDTHGIGIVLLAGIETLKMRKHLAALQHHGMNIL